MTVEEMAEAIGRAHGTTLDDVTRALWTAVSAGQIDEAQALRLSEAIDVRRTLARSVQAAAGRGFLPVRVISLRESTSSPLSDPWPSSAVDASPRPAPCRQPSPHGSLRAS